ncbi:MAG TPA: TonB family protein [Thermoanaerobaculaceae bacterium]|nr:TonB family protein [Thermoanaerobaculaceae bacterium]
MPLSGHSSDLSLADLVQANIYGRNTCRVLVATPGAHGVFFLADGAIVDARFGDLIGVEAFCALVNAENAHFRVDSGIQSPTRTIHQDWEGLLMEAMRLKDENKVPVPRRAPAATPRDRAEPPSGAVPAPRSPGAAVNGKGAPVPQSRSAAAPIALVPKHPAVAAATEPATRRAAGEPRPRPRARRGSTLALLVAVPVLAAAVGIVVYQWVASRSSAPPKAPNPAQIASLEAAELTEPGDTQPRLLQGPVPRAPDTSLAIAPTVVCRILIDESGAVADAKIFRSRLDLASFEETALEAVKSYRFAPAQRGGRHVRVWINWPVSFQ